MRVNIKLFAAVREGAEHAPDSLELPAGASVADAEASLKERLPAVAPLIGKSAFAVNQAFADRETTLRDGDELAVLPPVSGG